MRWAPSGLPDAINRLVSAIDRQFSPLLPIDPVRRPIYEQPADLPPASDWRGADVYVHDVGGGVSVIAFSNGTDWLRCDTLGVL